MNSEGGIVLPDGASGAILQIDQNVLDSLLIADGSVDVTGLSPVTLVELSGGGNITGAAVLQVMGSMSWTDGTMTGSGRTDIASAASLSMNTSQTLDLQRLVHNYGSASWNGSGQLVIDAAAFVNQSSGGFTGQGTGTIGSNDGTGELTNLGSYIQYGVMGVPSFADELTFANSGTVQVLPSARLTLLGTYEQTAGSTTIQGSGDMIVDGSFAESGGTVSVTDSGSTLDVVGSFTQSGGTHSVSLGAVESVAGPFTQSGGSLSVMGVGSLVSVTGTHQQTGGTSTFGGTGGRLSVTGTATLGNSALLTLSNGLLDTTGGLTLQAGATLNGYDGFITGDVTNAGIINLSSGVYTLNITGNYTQTGTLKVALAGTSNYSRLAVSGLATLGGTLHVDLLGFMPSPGNTFMVVTFGSIAGSFATYELPSLGFGVWHHNTNGDTIWVSYF